MIQISLAHNFGSLYDTLILLAIMFSAYVCSLAFCFLAPTPVLCLTGLLIIILISLSFRFVLRFKEVENIPSDAIMSRRRIRYGQANHAS